MTLNSNSDIWALINRHKIKRIILLKLNENKQPRKKN